jgi:hypothetical protein
LRAKDNLLLGAHRVDFSLAVLAKHGDKALEIVRETVHVPGSGVTSDFD